MFFRFAYPLVAAVLAGGALTQASTVPEHQLGKRATLPQNDPFYNAPSNLASLSPGKIIRSRKVNVNGLQFGTTAYQFLYRTTAVNTTTPIATVTTLLVPLNADLSKLVSYSIAEDAASTQCAPSYVLQDSGSGEASAINNFLQKGWPVTSSDHQGPDSSFAAGRLQGHAILDSIRATLAFKQQGFSGFKSSTKVAFAGYSGGGTAAAWAIALQPVYAKELTSKIAGAALGGVYANLEACLRKIDGTGFAGFVFPGVHGLASSSKAYSDRLNQVATAELRSALTRTRGQCASGNIFGFANQQFLSTKYTSLGDNFTKDSKIAPIYAQNILGKSKSETPAVPLYIYHGSQDQISPVESTDTAYKNWCRNNATSIEYIRVNGADHLGLALNYQTNVVNWIAGRFGGTAAVKGCVRRTPSN